MKTNPKTKCIDEMRRRILTLDLKPGTMLDEVMLANEYGVSRTPMREVIQRLNGDGYLVIEQNRGAKVAPMDLSSNASGMNALASFKAETTVAKVGFFKKGGKFTNRGVAAIGVSSAIVGGLFASKAVKHRDQKRARRHYVKPRRVVKKRYTPRVHKPVIAFNQNVYNQQTWLNQIGYNAGVADGKMGRNTRAVASQFQLANGMPATGYLTAPQTSFLAQQAALVLAQRTNPYAAVQTVAAPAVQYQQPVAPTAYAPQVQYVAAPTTKVLAQPHVQYAPAPQVQHVPATTAPVQPITYAPAIQPQPQNYVPAVQY